MSSVWSLGDLSHTQKLVLLCLADNANDDGVCWPSLENIRKRCSLHRSTVGEIIEQLSKMKYLIRKKRFSQSTVYTICCPRRQMGQSDIHLSAKATSVVGQDVPNHHLIIKETSDQIKFKKVVEKKGRLVSDSAISKASVLARQRGFSGGDELGIELEANFLGWIKEEPKNPDAAFLKWAPSYLRNVNP